MNLHIPDYNRILYPYFKELDMLYFKLEKNKLRLQFLQNCINRNVIPNGMRVHVNISLNNRPGMLNDMRNIMCETSTRVIFNVVKLEKIESNILTQKLIRLNENFCKFYNLHWWNWMYNCIVNKYKYLLIEISKNHF